MFVDRIDQEMKYSQQALNLRAFRQEILASNIANADTPNYKARDVDFKTALEGALGKAAGGGALALQQTRTQHLAAAVGADGLSSNRFAAQMQYRGELQSSVDGNTVNMDVERAAFAENAIQMEALFSFVNHQFKLLSLALQP